MRDPRPSDAVDPARAAPRHHLPLARERGARDPPAVADLADPVDVGHARPVEEHLVEVDLAAEVPERSHLDPGLVEVQQEVRDALALRGVGVGSGEEHGEVGEVRPRGPDLLPGHDPLVAVTVRRGRE